MLMRIVRVMRIREPMVIDDWLLVIGDYPEVFAHY